MRPQVPRPILYRELTPEDGPWAMIPYAWIYPPPPPRKMFTRVPQPIYKTRDGYVTANLPVQYYYTDGDRVWLPPPLHTTDLWCANQTYPL